MTNSFPIRIFALDAFRWLAAGGEKPTAGVPAAMRGMASHERTSGRVVNQQALAAFLWSVAELLRGDYKQSDYGKVILPFTVLRRLDCVLASTKTAVLPRMTPACNRDQSCPVPLSGGWAERRLRQVEDHQWPRGAEKFQVGHDQLIRCGTGLQEA